MRKILLITTLFIASTFAFKTLASEQITNYQTKVTLQKSSEMRVEETITYDFGTAQKHGIYRTIPFVKTNIDGDKFKLDMSNFTVTDEKGAKYSFTKTTTGEKIELKIGDADKYVTGTKIYKISYNVLGAITYFDTFDELYWNSIGTEWGIPIKNSSTMVVIPSEIPTDKIEAVCYTGETRNTTADCGIKINNSVVTIDTRAALAPNSGVTFAVKVPAGYLEVAKPTPYGKVSSVLAILMTIGAVLWYVVLPILVAAKWIQEKRFIQKNKRLVAAWFDAPKLNDKSAFTPAETTYLVTKQATPKLLVATIISLAQRGFFKIQQKENSILGFKTKDKFTFDASESKKTKKEIEALAPHEKILYNFMFITSTLIKMDEFSKSSFVKTYTEFNKLIDDRLVTEKLIQKDKGNETTGHTIKVWLLGFLGMMSFNVPLAAAVFLWTRNVGYTKKGVEKWSEAVSLKRFLSSQKDQLDFQAKNQIFFEKLLPYATAFGVEKIWMKKFKDLEFKPTDWYNGNLVSNQGIYLLNRELATGVSRVYASANRSSSGFSSGFSGGSSGGGGGGGGGGSW